MAERLPLLPLSLVLFPGMLLPLHIFEHRYRLMVARAVEKSESFGVVLIKSGREAGPAAEPHEIGTAARIVSFAPQADGRSLLIARGERRFAIEELHSDEEPYLMGSVRWLEEPDGDNAPALAAAAADAYGQYVAAAGAVLLESGRPALEAITDRGAPGTLAYQIAADLAVSDPDRQRLLELPTASERLGHEVRLLVRETELLKSVLVRIRAEGGRKDLN